VSQAPQVAPYTLKHIEDMLGMRRAVVSSLVSAGFVTPARGPRNELRFSFQDVVLLRTAFHLRSANVPPRRLLQALRQLRERLPPELPLSGLRIKAIGSEVAVKDGDAHWDAASGQLLMDFEVLAAPGDVTLLVREPQAVIGDGPSADELFAKAVVLETSDVHEAERGYRQALEAQPGHVDASINLGALLIDAARSEEAIDVLQLAIGVHADEPMLHFNLALALEDLGRELQALAAYEHCLALSPDFADAHYNAARLYERAGERQAALRHYSAYRRLS
jgi:tetratricopeptide (TPR) repeat protein